MRFGLLGTVGIGRDGEPASIPWPMVRNLLAALLLNGNRVISARRLVDVLWGEDPPASALASLQNHVMRLRALLAETGAGRVRTVAPGYLIEVAGGDLDLDEFERLSRRGRDALAAQDWEGASRELTAALNLWRGEPLADVTSRLLLEEEVPRLVQMHLDAVEVRIDADLQLGHGRELIAELSQLAAAHPLRERFHGQLMSAFYQAGRQAEALAAYQRARGLLVEELGIEPGPELQRIHQQVLAQDPRPAIATVRNVIVRPSQLPADLSDFTAREDQVKVLTELADSSGQRPGVVPVCIVTGPGGIGKTSLAVHAAHEIRDSFPDGQLLVRLGGAGPHPAEPVHVLGQCLRDLGVDPAQIPSGEFERAARFRSMLAGRRVLMVLDDACDSGQVAALLPGIAGCMVIVTSRNALADVPGARRLQLTALTSAQALELLSRTIGADRLQAEVGAAATVARLCAGLPLALRIAGSRLAARPHWQIEDLAGRLADAAARLDELTVGDLSVRASFSLSYASLRAGPAGLTPARAFRLLGTWAGPDISAPAAAALFGVALPAAEHALETLLDSHLVEPGDGARRYRFHDLLGLYAAERARAEESPANIDAAVSRLLGWSLHSTVAADQAIAPGTRPVPLDAPPDGLQPYDPASPIEALEWLTDELPNLRAAMDMAATRGDHQTTWKLAAALCTFHLRQRLWADWISTETTGLASAQAIGDRYGEAWLLNCMARARACLQQALEVARSHGNREWEGAALHNLAAIASLSGHHADAAGLYDQAIAIFHGAGDRYQATTALIDSGHAFTRSGEPGRAHERWRQARTLTVQTGDPRITAIDSLLACGAHG